MERKERERERERERKRKREKRKNQRPGITFKHIALGPTSSI
jgi:hypothetical protein